MDLTYNRKRLNEIKRKLVSNNLVMDEYPNMSLFKHKFIVYMIIDKANNKRYIGSTSDFNQRVNHYIYDVVNSIKSPQPIVKAMQEKGLENFRIVPIDMVSDIQDLRKKEYEYILRFRTFDPTIGYNVTNPLGDFPVRRRSYGQQHTAKTKANKAKFIAAINLADKIMYISEGLKLFADITNSSKDLVKNEARDCRQHRGYYIIYLNSKDRTPLYEKILEKQFEVDNNIYHTPTKRGRWKVKYDKYLAACNQVIDIFDNGNADKLQEEGYKCYYLHYDLTNEKPYIIDPIETFFNEIDLTTFLD